MPAPPKLRARGNFLTAPAPAGVRAFARMSALWCCRCRQPSDLLEIIADLGAALIEADPIDHSINIGMAGQTMISTIEFRKRPAREPA